MRHFEKLPKRMKNASKSRKITQNHAKSHKNSKMNGFLSESSRARAQNSAQKSMNLSYLSKNSDFQLLNGLDHQHEAIRSRSGKIMIFDPKIVRIG